MVLLQLVCNVRMPKQIYFFLILCYLSSIYCMPKCCSGRNVLAKTCLDGGPLNINKCKSKYFLEVNDSSETYDMDEHENLINGNEELIAGPHEFCQVTLKSDNSDVIVVCVNDQEQATANTVRTVNTSLQLVSVFFIILTILVYLAVPQMLDLQGLCIIHSISGLALGYTTLSAINLSGYITPVPCHFVAYLAYFSLLYSFFWTNVICFHIWSEVVNPRCMSSIKHRSLLYHLYGIGGPLILLIFLIVVHHADFIALRGIHPGIAELRCWFRSEKEPLIYFYGPISVLLTVNVVLFIWTVIVLWTQSKNCRETKVLKYRTKMYVKLFFIMGITWIFEVLSAVLSEKMKWIWYFTDALNALEGLIIFLILVVFRKKVIRALANREIFNKVRFPASWRKAQDSECEELEEEISLEEK